MIGVCVWFSVLSVCEWLFMYKYIDKSDRGFFDIFPLDLILFLWLTKNNSELSSPQHPRPWLLFFITGRMKEKNYLFSILPHPGNQYAHTHIQTNKHSHTMQSNLQTKAFSNPLPPSLPSLIQYGWFTPPPPPCTINQPFSFVS